MCNKVCMLLFLSNSVLDLTVCDFRRRMRWNSLSFSPLRRRATVGLCGRLDGCGIRVFVFGWTVYAFGVFYANTRFSAALFHCHLLFLNAIINKLYEVCEKLTILRGKMWHYTGNFYMLCKIKTTNWTPRDLLFPPILLELDCGKRTI